jgi:hypothetical protein
MNEFYCQDFVSLSTVPRLNLTCAAGKMTLDDDDRLGRLLDSSISICRYAIFEIELFGSVRNIAERLNKPKNTVLRCLANEMEWKNSDSARSQINFQMKAR